MVSKIPKDNNNYINKVDMDVQIIKPQSNVLNAKNFKATSLKRQI